MIVKFCYQGYEVKSLVYFNHKVIMSSYLKKITQYTINPPSDRVNKLCFRYLFFHRQSPQYFTCLTSFLLQVSFNEEVETFVLPSKRSLKRKGRR